MKCRTCGEDKPLGKFTIPSSAKPLHDSRICKRSKEGLVPPAGRTLAGQGAPGACGRDCQRVRQRVVGAQMAGPVAPGSIRIALRRGGVL